jgi:hypothetical protein
VSHKALKAQADLLVCVADCLFDGFMRSGVRRAMTTFCIMVGLEVFCVTCKSLAARVDPLQLISPLSAGRGCCEMCTRWRGGGCGRGAGDEVYGG